MRPAGRFVAEVLTRLAAAADVGVNLLELDALAHDMIRERGAESCYIDYHPSFGASPFGKVLCTSVNDAVLHGLPHDYVLRDGDLLSLDFAVVGRRLGVRLGAQRRRRDAAARGPHPHRHHHPGARRRDQRRAGRARRSATSPRRSRRWRGRTATRSTPSSAVTASAAPCTATRTCPTTAAPGVATRCVPGLVIAIEPWFLQTTDEIYTDRDGWTLRSADGSRGAHMEHTIAITDDGPLVLTARLSAVAAELAAGHVRRGPESCVASTHVRVNRARSTGSGHVVDLQLLDAVDPAVAEPARLPGLARCRA